MSALSSTARAMDGSLQGVRIVIDQQILAALDVDRAAKRSNERTCLVVDKAVELIGLVTGAERDLLDSVGPGAYVDDLWQLKPSWVWMKASWNSKHPGETSGRKIALRRFTVEDAHAPTVRLELQATEWGDVRALQEVLESGKYSHLTQGGLRYLCEEQRSLFPNMVAVHCVVETSDSYIVLNRRSSSTPFFPLDWSVSLEEGLALADLKAGQDAFCHASRRGVAEELLDARTTLEMEVTVLGFVVELPTLNPSIVTYARLPVSSAELLDRKARPADKWESIETATVPVDINVMAQVLVSDKVALPGAGTLGNWHGTSRYRMLAAMIHRFGHHSTFTAVKGVL